MRLWNCALWATLASAANVSAALSQQPLTAEQLDKFKETVRSICETVKEARGQKSEAQLQSDVQAKLGGFWGRFFDVGGGAKGAISREEFEGLSQEATATALQGDRDCREHLFNKLVDKLTAAQPQYIPDQSAVVPSRPTSRDISGQYYGVAGADMPNPAGGITKIYTQAVLDIRMSSEGNFEGVMRGMGQSSNMQSLIVRGKVSGDDIVFEGQVPNDTEHMTAEGKIIGNRIKGIYRVVGPMSMKALQEIRTRGYPEPPPGNFDFYK
jgi:hypothetical protein